MISNMIYYLVKKLWFLEEQRPIPEKRWWRVYCFLMIVILWRSACKNISRINLRLAAKNIWHSFKSVYNMFFVREPFSYYLRPPSMVIQEGKNDN